MSVFSTSSLSERWSYSLCRCFVSLCLSRFLRHLFRTTSSLPAPFVWLLSGLTFALFWLLFCLFLCTFAYLISWFLIFCPFTTILLETRFCTVLSLITWLWTLDWIKTTFFGFPWSAFGSLHRTLQLSTILSFSTITIQHNWNKGNLFLWIKHYSFFSHCEFQPCVTGPVFCDD